MHSVCAYKSHSYIIYFEQEITNNLRKVQSPFFYHLFQILSNEERRSNFDRYGQMDEKQTSGHSHHHGFHGFHNSFYFDESFFHFPR